MAGLNFMTCQEVAEKEVICFSCQILTNKFKAALKNIGVPKFFKEDLANGAKSS